MSLASLDCGFSIDSSGGYTQMAISGAWMMKFCSVLMCTLLFGNALFACTVSIPCTQLLPTISYLGCFPGHERVFVVACVLFALAVNIATLGAISRLSALIPGCTTLVIALLSLAVTLLLPALTLVDEVNGLYFAPQDWVHSYILIALLVFGYCWVYLVYGTMSDFSEKLTAREKTKLETVRKVVLLSAVATVSAIAEWQGAYSIYANGLLNENLQAICEWLAIGLGVFVPVYFCHAFEGFQITLSIPHLSTHAEAFFDLESESSKG